MDKLWRFTSCGILWMLNLLSWFRCCTVEWHNRKIGFTSSCCHHFIPRCIQIQFCQRCVTVSTEAAIHQRTCAFRFISFYCFYSVYSVFIVHLCLHTKYSSMRFSFYFFFFPVELARWEQRAAHLTAERLWHETGRVTGAVVHWRIHGRTTTWGRKKIESNRVTRCSLMCFCRGTAEQSFSFVSQPVYSYIFTRKKLPIVQYSWCGVARFISESIFGE